jgi:hypothetical protein
LKEFEKAKNEECLKIISEVNESRSFTSKIVSFVKEIYF